MAMAPPRKLPINPLPPSQETPPTGYDERVIVACKLPFAWIELQCEEPKKFTEEGRFGAKEVTVWNKCGDIVRIRGTAYPIGQPPEGFAPRPEMMFGYCLNYNISKNFWDKFSEQKADWPPLRSGAIFAFRQLADVKARAREMEGFITGFEPINPKGDRRVPQPIRHDLTQITMEEDQAKRKQAIL